MPANLAAAVPVSAAAVAAPPASLRQRARAPSAAELANIPWLAVLSDADRREAAASLMVVTADTGDRVCRTGAPSTFWFGVIDGLLKMSNVSIEGTPITYTGIPPGAW